MTICPGPGQQKIGHQRQHDLLRQRASGVVRKRHAIGVAIEQEPGVGVQRLDQWRQLQPHHPRRRCRLVRELDRLELRLIRMNANPCRSFSRRSTMDDVPLLQSTTTLKRRNAVEVVGVGELVEIRVERAGSSMSRPSASHATYAVRRR